MLVGVISDTHGLLRKEVFDLFADVGCIVHAGDIGDPAVLTELNRLAPVAGGLRQHRHLSADRTACRKGTFSARGRTRLRYSHRRPAPRTEISSSGSIRVRPGYFRPQPSGPSDPRPGGPLLQSRICRAPPLRPSGDRRKARNQKGHDQTHDHRTPTLSRSGSQETAYFR